MPLIVFILSLAFFCIHLILSKKRRSVEFKMQLLVMYFLVFIIGFQSFLSFMAHTFFANQTADLLGWAKNSPFQWEVGIANLAFSLMGFLSIWLKREFWVGLILGFTLWLWGDAIAHIRQMITLKDYSLNTSSSFFYSDLVGPLVLILSYIFYIKSIEEVKTWKAKFHHALKN